MNNFDCNIFQINKKLQHILSLRSQIHHSHSNSMYKKVCNILLQTFIFNLIHLFTYKLIIFMGSCCFSQRHVKSITTQDRTQCRTPTLGHDNSLIQLKSSCFNDLFTVLSCPIQNNKIIEGFNEVTEHFGQLDINENSKNLDWKRITFENYENNNNLWGVCHWKNQTDKILNGLGLLYEKGKNKDLLIGGRFNEGRLTKKEKYFKIFNNGAYYIGEINNEFSPHGHGQLYTNESEYYKGDFNQGVPHGEGQRKVKDRVFKGKFRNGQIIQGTQTTQKGSYTGTFKNNLKHGRGLLRMNSGMKYEGQFQNNKKTGEGILQDKDDKIIYQGKWKDDKQVQQLQRIQTAN